MQFLHFKTLVFLFLIAVCHWAPVVQSQSTFTPTAKPSVKPSNKPSLKPSRKPTSKPVHIYGDKPAVFLTQKAQQGVVGSLTILLFLLMAAEFLAPEVLFLIALMIVTGCQIITLPQAFAGFSNAALVTIGALFLVIGAVEKSHAVDYLARKAFGATGSILFGKARIYITCFALSIFFNNTPLVAILLPVLKDWGRMRKVPASQILIPLSYSVLSGSFVSMIGTSTNLTLDGLMQADRGYSFDFFAPAPIGIPLFFILLFYQLIFGPWLLPHRGGTSVGVNENADKLIAEVFVSSDSAFVGKTIATMMNSLGLAPSLALKIRRKEISPDAAAADIEGGSSKADKTITTKVLEGLSDPAYLKKISGLFSYPHPSSLSSRGLIGESSQKQLKTERDPVTLFRKSSDYFDIVQPSYDEILNAEDVVFIANAQVAVEFLMKSIAGESKGLSVLQSNANELPGYGTQVAELVVSDSNPFLGRKVSAIAIEFPDVYHAAVITVKGKEWGFGDVKESAQAEDSESKEEALPSFVKKVFSNKEAVPTSDTGVKEDAPLDTLLHGESISDHILGYGDTILVVTTEKNIPILRANRDFFVVSAVGELPIPMTIYSFFPVIIFFAMLVLAATETLDIAAGSMMAAAFFFLGGWIKAEEIPKLIDLRLLMLIGTSLAFATSMTTSGLALEIASQIDRANPEPFTALLLIYVITLLITELVSNNAAAALMYPIAVALADQLLVDFKPFAMAVLVAATAGFMSPIGYQTHVMVWAPGGYRFSDFLIFGFFPDVVYWIVGCAIIRAVYPF